MIEKVKAVDLDNEKYISMLSEPALNEEYSNIWENKQCELEKFLVNIFSVEKEQAYRRNRVFWGERYCELYKKMLKYIQASIAMSIAKLRLDIFKINLK